MSPINKQERIMQILTLFSEIYEDDISKSYIKLYIGILEEYPIEQIEFGLQKLIRGKTYKSYPTPGEFIGYMQDDRDNAEVQSTLAYEKVMRMCWIASDSNPVEFDDPAISRTIKILGGWPTVYQTIIFDKENLSILHSQFDKTYQRFYKARVRKACKLLGSYGGSDIKRLPEHEDAIKMLAAPKQ